MADSEIAIPELRARLNDMLADWGADLSSLLAELEEKRRHTAELESAAEERSEELEALSRRVEAQDELIESLQSDADEAATLRKEILQKEAEIEGKEAEIEKKQTEIASKQELIRALRRDAEKVGRLTGDGRAKDKEIERLTREKDFAEKQAAGVTEEFKALAATTLTSIDVETEVKALRAELDARKSLVDSLRGDAERTKQLEKQLDEKRAVIEQLESSVDRHVKSLAEMQNVMGRWKSAASAIGPDDTARTKASSALSQLSDEELVSLRSLEDMDVDLEDATTGDETPETLAETQRIPEPKITTNR